MRCMVIAYGFTLILSAPVLANAPPAMPKPGETYHCPNGFTFSVVRQERDGGLVLGNPADRTETVYTPEHAEKGTLYREQGFLGFFSLFVPDNGKPIVFITPDGPIEGCRVVP